MWHVNLQSLTLSLVYHVPSGETPNCLHGIKHPHQVSSCQIIQTYVLLRARVCLFALASGWTRQLLIPQVFSPTLVFASASSLYLASSVLVLQACHLHQRVDNIDTEPGCPLCVFQSRPVLYLCGICDTEWKLPVHLLLQFMVDDGSGVDHVIFIL